MDPWIGDVLRSQTLNVYNYALNNPVLYTDPLGECPICPILILLGMTFLVSSCAKPPSEPPTPGTPPSQRFDKIIFICGTDGLACARGNSPLHPFREWAERVGYSASDFKILDVDDCSGKAKLDCANQAEAEIESSGSARFLLIGHSAGGSAVIIAGDRVNNKGQIAGIVLLDPDMTATLEDDIIDITYTELQTMANSLPKPVFLGDSPEDGLGKIAGAHYWEFSNLSHMNLALRDEVVDKMLYLFKWSELK